MKRVTSISASAVIRVFGLHLNTWGEKKTWSKRESERERAREKEMESAKYRKGEGGKR